MALVYQRRLHSMQWGTHFTPSMEEKLQNEISKSGSVQVLLLYDRIFEVRGESVDIVDIDNWD
ncbi:hypothetical protein U1Q18_010976, partial [Sarracenia purpurea var. burkii]